MTVSDLILHQYPQPIAKCYERMVSAHSPFERVEKARQLVEVTVKYSACISIAEYLQAGAGDEGINGDLPGLTRPSLGHWLKLFRSCVRFNHAHGPTLFPPGLFAKRKDVPDIAAGYNAMAEHCNGEPSRRESVSVLDFMGQYVSYRNKTVGHGAPSREHVESIAPVLATALTELLAWLECLRKVNLIYLRDIRVERDHFVHSLTKLMGTSRVPLPDFSTKQDVALVGGDRQLFVSKPDEEIPYLNLHPLVIFANENVYLLHQSDLSRGVDYICHHSGDFYSADRIFEDFRERFGALLEQDGTDSSLDADEVYLNAVRISLIDGIIEQSERDYLEDMRRRLGLTEGRAEQLETFVRRELEVQGGDPAPSEPEIPRSGPRADTILFLSYASVRSGFWSELVSRLAPEAQKRRLMFSIASPDPVADYDPAAMIALVASLDEIIELHRPRALIMAPSPSPVVLNFFERWLERFELPTVTVDTEFADDTLFERLGRGRPPLVQVDNEAGGRLAGELLLSVSNDPDNATFLVMPGIDDAPHSEQRVKGFESAVGEGGAKVRRLPEGEFLRHEAKRVFDDFLLDADLRVYDGIFCCNDEMALGVFQALAGLEGPPSLPIVGFNGTMEMRTLLTVDRSGLLLGTIDQNFQDYVETIYTVLDRVLSGEETEDRHLIEPRIVIRPGLAAPHGSPTAP